MKIQGIIKLENNGGFNSAIISANTSGELILTPRQSIGTNHIGIGTGNPKSPLHIKQNEFTLGQGQLFLDALAFGSQYEATVMFGHAGNVRGIFGYENATGKMHIKRSVGGTAFSAITNNAAMTWDLNGVDSNRIGINNESPSAMFDVVNGAPGTTSVIFRGSREDSASDTLQLINSAGTINTVFEDGGNVGIGTNAPGAKLDVRGSAIFNEDGGDFDFRVEGDLEPNLFWIDAGNNNINISAAGAATTKFHIDVINESSKAGGVALNIASNVSSKGIAAVTSHSTGSVTGIFGQGVASGLNQQSRGVWGEAIGGTGYYNYGIYGRAGNGSIENIGVYGIDTFGDPTSLFSTGVYGVSQGNSPENNGVYGQVSGGGTATTATFAVRAVNSANLYDITNYGVHSKILISASRTGNTNYSVYVAPVAAIGAGNINYGLVVEESDDFSGFGTITPTSTLHVAGGGDFDLTGGGAIMSGGTDLYSIFSTGGGATGVVADTGTVIHFSAQTIFDLPSAPSTGNYTDSLTDSEIGIVQKMYHNHTVAPTFPAGWVLLGDGVYFTSELNIIHAEWVDGTRVEYWITQEQ